MTPGLFRLFLAFVVVIHHSFPLRLGGWAVGMFFALSGFWISRMWRQKYSKFDSPIRTFLISRWWRLAPVFLAVNALTVGLVYSGFNVGIPDALQSWQWWVTQPMVAGSTQVNRLLPPAWSLDVEMQFYVIAPILVAGLAFVARRDLMIVLLTLLGWALLRMCIGASIEESRLDLHAWIFAAGCAVERLDWRPSKAIQITSVMTLVVLVTVAMALSPLRQLVWQRGTDGTTLSHSAHVAFYVAMVLAGLPFAMGTVYRTSGNLDRWLGDLSFPLYMFHWLSRDWYYSVVDWTMPAWQNGVLLLVNILIATFGAIALLHLIDRPAQHLRSRWMRSASVSKKLTTDA